MLERWGKRRQGFQLNPFVVLSDVTMLVIALLLLYFTTLLLVQRARQQQEARAAMEKINWLGSQLDQAKRERDDARGEANQAQTVHLLEEEEQRRVKRLKQVQERVQTVVDDPGLAEFRKRRELNAYREGDTQVFTFGEQVLFNRGDAAISQHGKQVLNRFGNTLADYLRRYALPERIYPEIQVQGHADSTPADNWTLSTARAVTVVKFLDDHTPLQRAFMSAAGYSWHRPVEPIRVGQDQPKNRRIEVRLVYGQKFIGGKPWDHRLPPVDL